MRGLLERYSVLLLDMNNTFMFGEDRFGADVDYVATYRSLGGALDAAIAASAIQGCYDHLEVRYADPGYQDRFPSVVEAFQASLATKTLPDAELQHLERTFAAHELGFVPPEYAEKLQCLARKFRLGLVADIWSQKPPWLAELERADVLRLFDVLVFSSDGGSVKPSPRPFWRALAGLGAAAEETIVVGDSARRDAGGAAAAGLASLLVGNERHPAALGTIPSLLDLA